MRIVYTRPPDRVTEYRHELLFDGPDMKVSRLEVEADAPPVRVGVAHTPPGGAILWFVFPSRWYEVAAVFDAGGALIGHYTNIVRPADFAPGEWRITDLFLDVWQAPGDEPRLLDVRDLEEALAAGSISSADAEVARREADAVLASARAGRWPSREIRRWTSSDVRSLRYRRDAPATWHANRIVGRIIAFGIYLLGVVSVTSLLFAAVTDAFVRDGRSLWMFLVTIGAEAAILLPLALAGWLPATRRPRLEESMSEKTLFIGALVSGAAVLLNPNADLWRGALAGVYGVLALFLTIFGVCRIVYERHTPWMALAGVAVAVLALIALL